MKRLCIIFTAVLTVLCSCGKNEDAPASITCNPSSVIFESAGGTRILSLASSGAWTAGTDGADWITVNPEEGKGNEAVTLKCSQNKGQKRDATVTFTTKGKTFSVSVSQRKDADTPVIDDGYLDPRAAFAKPLSREIMYSTGTQLYMMGNVMQGFDFTDEKHFYYSQCPSTSVDQYISFVAGPNLLYSNYMIVERFGHMTQIVAEAASDGKTYIWCNSNGQSMTNGYGNSWTISRIEYKPGAKYTGGYAGETFFLEKNPSYYYDLQVSVDFEARRLLIGCRSPKEANMRFHFIYNLDEVLALPLEELSCTVKMGSNESITGDGASRTETRKIQARDLSRLTPLGQFKVPRGKSDSETYYYSHQGHEVYGNYVWFYEGQAKDGTKVPNSIAFVTVFDYTGKVVIPRTQIAAVGDDATMKSFGFTYDGSAEAESMKVKDGTVYLGFACHSAAASKNRIQNILRYQIK